MILAKDIKERLTLSEVMEYYGVKINSRGFALCPFHKEKTPSLSVKDEHFHCFGCGERGDHIDFVKKYFGLSFHDALKKINDDFSLDLGAEISAAEKKEMQKQMDIDRRFKEHIKREKKSEAEVYDSLCRQLIGIRNVLKSSPEPGPDLKKLKKRGKVINMILDDYNEGGILLRAFDDIRIKTRACQRIECEKIHLLIENIVEEMLSLEEKQREAITPEERERNKERILKLSERQRELNLYLIGLGEKYTERIFASFEDKFMNGPEYREDVIKPERGKNGAGRGARS